MTYHLPSKDFCLETLKEVRLSETAIPASFSQCQPVICSSIGGKRNSTGCRHDSAARDWGRQRLLVEPDLDPMIRKTRAWKACVHFLGVWTILVCDLTILGVEVACWSSLMVKGGRGLFGGGVVLMKFTALAFPGVSTPSTVYQLGAEEGVFSNVFNNLRLNAASEEVDSGLIKTSAAAEAVEAAASATSGPSEQTLCAHWPWVTTWAISVFLVLSVFDFCLVLGGVS